MAQLDPDKWGEDADKFVKRPNELYEKYSLGFAEKAQDGTVADGKMNRNCPGRSLSLLMGTTFLRKFRIGEWMLDQKKSDIPNKVEC